MPLLPTRTPSVADPMVEAVLAPRWRRARRLLALSVAMPALVALGCAVALGFASVGWWSAAPLLGAIVPPVAHVLWLRRGVFEPSGWLKAAFLVCGAQFLVGVVPVLGAAGGAGAGAVAGAPLVLALAGGAVSLVAARRAHHALLAPLVPELGATGFRLAVAVRFALAAPAPISARLDVHTDRIGWTARSHRGRGDGPRVSATVPFAVLRRVEPTVLTGEPLGMPWLTLPDGAVLYARPGPALRLVAVDRTWVVPVDDAPVLAQLVDRRRSWFGRSPDGPGTARLG